jgi:hypothetical protein
MARVNWKGALKKGAKQTGIKQELGVCAVLLLLQNTG